MKTFLTATTVALLCTGSAQALTVTIGDASPTVIDGTYDAFYVTETATPNGGAYTIHNNTSNLTLIGFGVSNPSLDAVATIDDNPGAGFVTFSDGNTVDFWRPMNLVVGNWASEALYDDYYDTLSDAQALFGDFADALDGEDNANYFEIFDASGLAPGLSGADFGFAEAQIASTLFGVAVDGNNNTFAFIGGQVNPGTTPTPNPGTVPLPAAGWMLLAGLGGLGALRRRAS